MNNLILTKEENKKLEELLIFTKRLEELYFSENNNDLIPIIDEIIDKKLSTLDTTTVYKMLNKLFMHNLTETKGTEILVLNNLHQDLSVKRLAISLSKILTYKNVFCQNIIKGYSKGFRKYYESNYLCSFFSICEKANYMYMLDHAQLFLGLLNDASNEIDKNEKERITKTFLFLYKELDEEFKTKAINKKSCTILSQRYNNIAKKDEQVKTYISIVPFTQAAMEMLTIEDDQLTKNDITKLEIGKLYLDSFLIPLSNPAYDNILQHYQLAESTIHTRNHETALEYIYKSFVENDKEKEEKIKSLSPYFPFF